MKGLVFGAGLHTSCIDEALHDIADGESEITIILEQVDMFRYPETIKNIFDREIAEVTDRGFLDKPDFFKFFPAFELIVEFFDFLREKGDRISDTGINEIMDVTKRSERFVRGILFRVVIETFIDLKIETFLQMRFFKEISHRNLQSA
ncbi:MAG: hypothetical protein ACLRQU_17035 [Clostridium sp.]|nr:hypothetical protein [[Clostridium] innocuum]MCR0527604.1 hypothetical protein [[Clostridium] innocuum]